MGATIHRTTCNRDEPHDQIQKLYTTGRAEILPPGNGIAYRTSCDFRYVPPLNVLWAAVAVATVGGPVWKTTVSHAGRAHPTRNSPTERPRAEEIQNRLPTTRPVAVPCAVP